MNGCGSRKQERGFTLVEMLVVVAIIALMAAILVPSLGVAQKTAKKHKADLECNAIKTAVEQFCSDFRYMPWGKADDGKNRVGADQWAEDAASQKTVMAFLQGDNKLHKAYLEISSRDSGTSTQEGVFFDPWGNPYRIGMDRNMDEQIQWRGKTYKARVLVYSSGPDGTDNTEDDIRTFDAED